jgi:hypothetical protein
MAFCPNKCSKVQQQLSLIHSDFAAYHMAESLTGGTVACVDPVRHERYINENSSVVYYGPAPVYAAKEFISSAKLNLFKRRLHRRELLDSKTH